MSTKNMLFCDQCGKPMSVVDVDGDVVVNGYQLRRVSEHHITYSKRTTYGSSSKSAQVFFGDMCSDECLKIRMNKMLNELGCNLKVVGVGNGINE